MKCRILLGLTVLGLLTQLPMPVRLAAESTVGESHSRFISFDAPGAGERIYEGTFGVGINSSGQITGYYADASFVYHGFLRSPEGAFTTFDAPDAGAYGTFPYGLNSDGTIVGLYSHVAYVEHGFLRHPDSTFATFTDPDACTTADGTGCYGSRFFDINDSGEIAGSYVDANFVFHSFLLNNGGALTVFEAPGAGDVTGSYQGTQPAIFSALNNHGEVIGSYTDASNVEHGFSRSADGTITDFDAPGAGTGSGQGTFPVSLTDTGVIAGAYIDASSVYHAFLRNSDGTITNFDAPGAGTGVSQGTIPENINANGEITGNYIDGNNVSHGFLTASNGVIVTFDAPGAGKENGATGCGSTSGCPGTYPYSNNASGEITGYYIDGRNRSHGFLRTP